MTKSDTARVRNAPPPQLRSVWRVARWFRGQESNEQVRTRIALPVTPQQAWNAIVFYEEIPLRPPLVLRALMPSPIRTVGEKSRPGAQVDCFYEGGHLTKRITACSPPQSIEFEVLHQQLGIEDCVAACNGSYSIFPSGGGADVLLMTRYRTCLHPRWLFRPLERFVLHTLHRHVLRGLRAKMRSAAAAPAVPLQAANNEEAHAYAGNSLPATGTSAH